MATAARFGRNTGSKNRRSRVVPRENQVLAMTCGAVRRILHPRLDALSVNTLPEGGGDFLVTLPTSSRDIPMTYTGLRIARGQNSMAAVTVGASCRLLSSHYCPAVH